MKRCNHPNIPKLLHTDLEDEKIYLIEENRGKDLLYIMKNSSKIYGWSIRHVKYIIYEVLKTLYYLKSGNIVHRDIKPENILIKENVVKLADFGSCRGIYSKKPYTEYISTRWYRAPECLLTDGYYGQAMDIWGMGCVIYEMLTCDPLFPGANEMDQIKRIHSVLGTPPQVVFDKFKPFSRNIKFNFPIQKGTGIRRLLTQYSPEVIDLIERMLIYDPDERITAKQALQHPWLKQLYDNDHLIEDGKITDENDNHLSVYL